MILMFLRKIIVICFIAAVALFSFSCRSSKLGEYPPDWLVYHLSGEPDTLNPLTSTDAYADTVLENIYETLLKRNLDTLELEPNLAESYSVEGDGKIITFKLRKGVRFTDGHEMTAHDVEYYYRKVMDPKVDCPHLRNYLNDIKDVEVPDDYTFRVIFAEPYFRALEISGYFYALPKHLFEKPFEVKKDSSEKQATPEKKIDDSVDFNKSPLGRAPTGSGPYKFVKWVTGQEIVIERNEEYWGKKPGIKRIIFKFINKDSTALIELKKHHLDVMGLTAIQWVKQSDRPRFSKAFRKEQYYLPNYSYIGWNMRRPLFQDKMVRRAMTMLVDRERILKTLRFGLGQVVSGPAYISSPYYDSIIEPWPYDPEAAKKLLDDAGWIDRDGDHIRDKDGVPFRFEFIISSGSTFADQLSTILQQELKNAGIEMSVRRLEWATFLKLIDEHNFDATTLAWSLGIETDPYQLWHSSQAVKGSNFVGFVNKEADDIIVKNRRAMDVNERIVLMKKFHAILHEEQPYTFMLCSPTLRALNRRFENAIIHKLGIDMKEWTVNRAYVEE